MSKIDPTVGRVVWFHPATNSTKHGFEPNAICAAQIARVLPDGRLNLGVLDGNGAHHPMTEVPLIQERETAPENGYWAEWMPYQRGQAERTEALEKELSSKSAEDFPLSAAAQPVTTP